MISPDFLRNPHIRLFGNIDDLMVNNFLTQLDRACGDDRGTRNNEGQRQVVVAGPLRANIQIVREVLADLENGLRIEHENFAQLIQGTDIPMDEVVQKAKTAWYMTAEEALARKLVQELI